MNAPVDETAGPGLASAEPEEKTFEDEGEIDPAEEVAASRRRPLERKWLR